MPGIFRFYAGSNPVEAAALTIEIALRDAVSERGRASLMVSGGRSPKPLYETLSKAELDWANVSISLVDERWVNPGEAGSNEDFIKENLIQNAASQAKFIGLKTSHGSVSKGLSAAQTRLVDIANPFDVCVLGMGSDGHTASWFPNSKGLAAALSSENPNKLCYVDATGCEGAGAHTDRITLTLNAVLDARKLILFIPGEEKRNVFHAAAEKKYFDAPVQALTQSGEKLHIYASSAT